MRTEIAAQEKPTAAMTRQLAKLDAAEAKLGARYQAQGEKLQRLGNELGAAGVDISQLGEHEEKLGLKTYEANKRLDEQTRKLERLERVSARAAKVRAAGQKISGAGMGLSLGVTLPALAEAKVASDAAIQSAHALAQVQAALASMGPKAGRSLAQLQAQAEKLQATSLFDDDDIMKSVTANLLTFGKVSGPIFDKAQQAAVDLSARLGQDLQSSAIQLGKALNDPLKGVTALQRVGVSFSAEQKKQIENYVKHNQLAKAQGIILGELQNQFAGAAKAARDADPNAARNEQWRTFQENVGGVVNVLLPRLNALLERALRWFNGLSPAMQTNIVNAVAITAAIGPLLVIFGRLVSGVGMIIPLLARLGPLFMLVGRAALQAGMMMLANPMVLVITLIVVAIAAAAYLIWKHWDTIKAAFSSAGAWIMAKLGQLKSVFLNFPLLFGPLGVAAAFIINHWAQIRGAFGAGVGFLASLPARMGMIGAQIIQGLIGGITGRLSALKSTIVNAASSAANWFKQKLGIHSPSRVFMGFGGHITDGLGRGIAAGTGAAVKHVDRLSSRVAGAFAAGALVASPAIAGTPAQGSSSSSAAASPASLGPIEIHIHQQAGQSAAELARLVAEELKRLQASSTRSSYHDE